MKKHQHVVPKDNAWGVTQAMGRKASKTFKTKGGAIRYAKGLAKDQKVCMIVHDKDGKFEEFNCKPEIHNQHVVPRYGKWAVITAGGGDVSKFFSRKSEAINHAREIAQDNQVCMVVHHKDRDFKEVDCEPGRRKGFFEVTREWFN